MKKYKVTLNTTKGTEIYELQAKDGAQAVIRVLLKRDNNPAAEVLDFDVEWAGVV